MKIKNKYVKIVSIFISILMVVGISYNTSVQTVDATVTNNGVLFYGDATNAGVGRARVFTNPATFATEINGISGSASQILWTIAKTAPTREEIMIGQLKVDGRLDISTCTTACDANGDYTARWNNVGTTGTQDCDSAPTASTCERAFDIAYMQLNGKAMVVYGDNVADKVYYAVWDGSSWAPNSTPGTPGVSNELGLPGTAGTPEWIRVIARGDQLAETRTNELMLLVGDTNADIHAFYWDGDSWDAGTTLATNLTGCTLAQCFDGGWETLNGEFIALYATATATGRHEYAKFTAPSTWTTTATAFTASTAGQWVQAASDPTSDRIMFSSSQSGDDVRADVWKNDGSTGGFTVCSATGCPDTAVETVDGNQSSAAWERFNSEGALFKNLAGTTSTTQYLTRSGTTFSAQASAGITSSDDNLMVLSWGAPNSDDMMVIAEDVDCDVSARLWTGAGFGTLAGDLELDVSNYGLTCPNLTGPGTDPGGAAQAAWFAWKMYSTWQRNWRFYSGADSANTPTTALANQNTIATDIPDGDSVRLRVNYAERGTLSATDQRKKLQYTTGCDPDTDANACTWTDVDDPGAGGIWRYSNGTFTDGNLLAGVVLTGTNGTCTAGNGCGTWVLDKDAAAGTNMDHNGNIIQENEYVLQANGVASNTTYYFRVWDLGQDSPVYIEQDQNDCGTGGVDACTYPRLTTRAFTVAGTANGNNGATVKVAYNGTVQGQTGTISGSAWTITGLTPPSVGDIVTAWIDGVADNLESTAVTKYSSGSIAGMVLDTNVFSIGSNQNTSVSVTNLGLCDQDTGCITEDLMHVSNSGLFIGDDDGVYTGESLSVLTGDTLTIASASSETIIVEKITNAGTITATGTPTISLAGTSGTLFTNSGTFTQATSTVNLSGNGDATINSGTITFYNLTISGTGTKSLGAATTLATSGTLTISAGTFNPATFLVTGSGSNTIAVSAGATLQVDASTFAGNYSAGFGTLTFNATSIVEYDGGTQTILNTPTYGNLTVSAAGTKTLGGNTTASGTVTVSAGTLDTDSGNNRTLTASKILISGGVFNANASTINLTGTIGTLLNRTSGTFNEGTSTFNITNQDDQLSWVAGNVSTDWYTQPAVSANGARMVASNASNAGFYYSTNYGVTWTQSNKTTGSGADATISHDGLKAAIASAGVVYTSTDGGATWSAGGTATGASGVAGDSDGTNLAAVAWSTSSKVRTSTDSGANFADSGSITSTSWNHIASSATGNLLASISGGQLYTSTDGGVNWVARDSARQWKGVASSYDGTKLAAVVFPGYIYTSTDSGANWSTNSNSSGSRNWFGIASSADGQRLVANVYGGGGGANGLIYTSDDAGVTWVAQTDTDVYNGGTGRRFNGPASSAGGMFAMSVSTGTGPIYVSEPVTLASGVTSFYNLTLASGAYHNRLGEALSVTNDLTISGGSLDTNAANSYAVSAKALTLNGGAFTPNASTVTLTGTTGTLITKTSAGTFVPATSTVTLSGSGSATVNSGEMEFYNLTSSGTGTKTLGANIEVQNVLTNSNASGTFALSSYNLTLSGTTGTPVSNSGTINTGTGTVIYSGNNSGGNTSLANITYYDLRLNSDTETFVPVANLTVSNKLYITDGTLDTTTVNDYAITAGKINFSGTPTVFGNATIGGTNTGTYVANSILMGRFVASSTGTINQVNFYNESTGSSSFNVALYADNAGNVGSLIATASSVGSMDTSFGWDSVPLRASITSGQAYWLAALPNDNLLMKYDAYGSNWAADYYGATYPTFPTSFTANAYYGAIMTMTADVDTAGNGGTLVLNDSTVTLTGTGTVFDATGGTIDVSTGTSTIKLTDSSTTAKSFYGADKTYDNIWLAPGVGTGTHYIFGDNTFLDFKDDGTGAHTIIFEDGSTTTIDSLTLDQTSPNITLQSQTTGTAQWNLVDTAGTNTIRYVTVKDSCASGGATWDGATYSANNTDGGNNCGWVFTASITISGTADDSNTATVRYAVNGTLRAQTGTIGSGTWTITGVAQPSTDDIVTVWIDNVADGFEAVGATKYDTGNITGVVLNKGVLTIGSNQNTLLSATDLGLYDANDDEDIMHTSNSGVLLVQGASNSYTGETLSILTNNTLTINSTSSESLTTEKINNSGNLELVGSPTVTISGTSGTLFTNNGSFSEDNSTVNFTGNGDATINSGLTTFYNLTSSGTGTKSLGGDIYIAASGTLTVSAGTFNPAAYSVSVPTGPGSFVSLDVSSGATIIVNAADFTSNYNNIDNKNLNSNSTVNYNLSGSQNIDNQISYGNILISGSGTKTLTGNTTALGTITVTSGTLDTNSGSSYDLTAPYLVINGGTVNANASNIYLNATSGTLFTISSGTFNAGTSLVRSTGNGNTTINSATVTFYAFQNTGTGTKTLGANLTLDTGNLIVYAGTINPATYTFNFTNGSDITACTSTFLVPATTFAGSYSGVGAYALCGGDPTLEYSRSGAQTVTNPSDFFGAINTSGSGTKTLGASISTGSSTIGTGTTLAIDTYTLTLSGSGTPLVATGTFDAGTGTVKFTGNGAVTIPAVSFYNLSLEPTITASRVYTLNTTSVTNDFTINPTAASSYSLTATMAVNLVVAGTLTLDGTTSAQGWLSHDNTYDLTVGKIVQNDGGYWNPGARDTTFTGTSGTLYTKNGGSQSFSPGSEFFFTPDADVTLFAGSPYTNLPITLSPILTGNRVYTMGTGSGSIGGNFTINPSGSANSLTVDLSESTYVSGDTLITRTGGNATSVLDTNSVFQFNTGRLEVATGGTFTGSSTLCGVNATSGTLLTNSGGTYTACAYTTFSPDASVTLTSGAFNFNVLEFTNIDATVDRTYTFGSGAINASSTCNLFSNSTTGKRLTIAIGSGGLTCDSVYLTTYNSGLSTLDLTNGNLTTGSINYPAGSTINADDATITLTGGSGTILTGGGTFDADTSTVNMTGNGSATINNSAITFYNLTSSGTGTKTFGAGTVTINGALTVNAGTVDLNAYYIYVPGTITVNSGGTLDDTSAGSINEFRGLVTVNSGGTWATTANSNYRFVGGLTVNSGSTFTSGSGNYYFDTDAQTIGGTGTYTITNLLSEVSTGNGLTFSGAQPAVTNLTQSSNAVLTFSGTVPTITTPDFTASGNTVRYTGTVNQSIIPATYHHLYTSGNSSKELNSGNVTVNGNLTVTGSTQLDPYDYKFIGSGTNTLTADGAQLNARKATFTANYESFETIDLTSGSGSTVWYAYYNAQTIDNSITYSSLSINNSNGGVSLGGNTTMNGNLTISAGVFDPGSYTLTANGGSNLLYTYSTSKILVNASTFAGNYSGFESFNLDQDSSVDYAANSSQTIDNTISYKNLIVSGGANAVKTLSGNLTIQNGGSLTASGAIFDPSTYQVGFTGNTGTIIVDTDGTLRVGGATWSDSYANYNSVSSPGSNQTIEWSRSGAQTVTHPINADNIKIGGSGTKTLGANISINGQVNITAGTLDTDTNNNYSLSAASVALNGGTFVPRSSAVNLTGTGTVFDYQSGTFTAGNSTIKLTNSSGTAKTFAGGGQTFHEVWFSGTGAGEFTITGGNTFNKLKIENPPHTVKFTNGTTQTVSVLEVSGKPGSLNTLKSTNDGSTWTIQAPGSILNRIIQNDFLSIRDSIATGTILFYAEESSNVSNNTGWVFGYRNRGGGGSVESSGTPNASQGGGGNNGGQGGSDISGYTFCANENQDCVLTGTQDIAYGANGAYFFKYNQTGTINCSNNVFGDPIPTIGKYCYVKNSVTNQGGGSGQGGGESGDLGMLNNNKIFAVLMYVLKSLLIV